MSESSTKLKKFEGYPHSIEQGIEYNGDYVEGGEIAITFPDSADMEFIVRKDSPNNALLREREDLREGRDGDPISDASFYMEAEEIVKDEMKALMVEGIDPVDLGGKASEVFAQGGTRMRHAPGGLTQQSAPREQMIETMTEGENVGWTILDFILPVDHFTGYKPSEMWSGKINEHSGKVGSAGGGWWAENATPVGQSITASMGGPAGAIAGIGMGIRKGVTPTMNDALQDEYGSYSRAYDPAKTAQLESVGSSIGGMGSDLIGNIGNMAGDTGNTTDTSEMIPDQVMNDKTFGTNPGPMTDEAFVDGQNGYHVPESWNKNGGGRKKYADGGGRKREFDWNAISAGVTGFTANAFPAFQALADNKDYDKVRYPLIDPQLLTADLPLRESRDAFATSAEALKSQGKLDIGAMAELATQSSKSSAGIRENIQNANVGILNQSDLQNQATLIQQYNDEAANKGQSATNRHNAMQQLSTSAAGGERQRQMAHNDQYIKMLFKEVFGETI